MSTALSPNSELEDRETFAPHEPATALRRAGDIPPLAPASLAPDEEPPNAVDDDPQSTHEQLMRAAEARFDEAVRALVATAPDARLDVRLAAVPRRSLDPDVLPAPPLHTPWRGARSGFLRHALLVGFAALVAAGVTIASSFGPYFKPPENTDQGNADQRNADQRFDPIVVAPTMRLREPLLLPRLIVEDRHALANQPLPLELSVEHAAQDASIRLAGLVAGSRLSAGAPIDNSSWTLPLPDLKDLYLYAPANFVGVMNAGIDLLSRDQRLIDRRGVRLEWLAAKVDPPWAPPASAPTPIPELPVLEGPAAPVKLSVMPTIDPAVVSMLMKRGQNSLAAGDIEAARIAFARLADAGIAEAALAEATTYDYRYLNEHHVIGVRGDQTKARALYQKAMQLGSKEAGAVLAQMPAK